MTEFVSPVSPPNPEPISQFSATSTVEADVLTATQAVVLNIDLPLFTPLTLPMLTSNELALFICTTFIIPKLTENITFFLCREQFFTNTITHILFHSVNYTSEEHAFNSLNSTT